MRYFLGILILFFVHTLNDISAQQDVQIKKLVEIGKTDNQTMNHQDVLCNRIGGRPIGSDNYTNAALWALSEFKKWGLNAELDDSGIMPLGFNRGPWFGKMIKPKLMHLDFGTPSFTAGTKGVQRGSVVIFPQTQAKFDSLKEKIKGSWVLIDGINDGWPRDKDSVRAITKKLLAAVRLVQFSYHTCR
jgi:carboxypeptidase Q